MSKPVNVPVARRERWSWIVYDFAQTIFSMNILTLYFAVWLVSDLGASNIVYASASAAASLLVALSIPVLGALSDVQRRHKNWVVGFSVLAAAACVAVGALGQTTVPVSGAHTIAGPPLPSGWHGGFKELRWVLLTFVAANYCFQAAHPFYNAMLPELAPPERQGRLSGLGTAAGYVGSIVGVLMVLPFFTGKLPLIGAVPAGLLSLLRHVVPFTAHGGRVATFAPTGILFAIFSAPLFAFCRDHAPAPHGTRVPWGMAFQQVGHTLQDARRHPGALRFILSSFVYQDAIGTIIAFMTLYAVKAVGFAAGSEVTLFLVLTIPAVLGSYLQGHLVDRAGPKRALTLTLTAWVVLLAAMIAVPSKTGFWVVGFAMGLNYGGVPTSERPMLLTLIPREEAGRYFSLMLLSSRVAAVIGPLIWALTVDGLQSNFGTALAYRAAVMAIALMFVIALILLRRVPDRSLLPGASGFESAPPAADASVIGEV